MKESERDQLISAAESYNRKLASNDHSSALSEGEMEEYNRLLDVTGTGIMGYIEIPAIDVSLPIYHGCDEGVLQIAVGHVDWTSLPVGGISTHCVLSGHRGLPSAQLFTHLDRLVEGDVFMISVLDHVITYEVDQILIVLPEETKDLEIVNGEDYCTLVTCTPYGVNTHRLLVRGHRIENLVDYSNINITSEAMQIETLLVAACIAVPILLILLIILLLKRPAKKPAKKLAEQPAENSDEPPAETPVEKPEEPSAGQPAEIHDEIPAEKPADKPAKHRIKKSSAKKTEPAKHALPKNKTKRKRGE